MLRPSRTIWMSALVAFALLTPGPLAAQRVVGWRGDGTGRYPDARPPLEWTATKNIAWSAELPGGSPAPPVLVGGRLFVASDPATLYCVDAAKGTIAWKRSHLAADLGPEAGRQVEGDGGTYNPDGDAGSAGPTPVSDGKVVFAEFANGVVSAHRLDGTRVWMRFLERPKTGYGHASSPTLVGNLLLVHFVDLVALDAATGAEKWRKKLPATHSTSVAFKLGGVDLAVHPSGAILRVADGAVLADKLFHLHQSSPVIDQSVIYAHENGRIVAWQLPAQVGERLEMTKLWEADAPRGQYQIASPVVHDGLLYGVSMNGIFHARKLATGEEVYRERFGSGGRVYVSATLAGDHLFVADQNGRTAVIRPGPRFALQKANELELHPSGFTFDGRRMYLRTWRHLYCVAE